MDIAKLNKWLKQFNVSAEIGEDFEYSYSDEIIYVAEETHINDDIINLCNKYGVKINSNNFRVLCLLHELGHHYTLDDFGSLTNIYYNVMTRLLYKVPVYNKTIQSVLYFIYHRLPQEKAATKWACTYMLKHPTITKRLMYII